MKFMVIGKKHSATGLGARQEPILYVLLPCTFSVKNSNNGLKFVIITWKRNGIQLAQYQAETMKDTSRAALLINELPKGDASLLLRNVTISDEGDYECEVHEAPNTRSGNVSLKITERYYIIHFYQHAHVLVPSGKLIILSIFFFSSYS
uniref:Ig-like domain-containing protein n=1 Tax=Erpetoichthys calabaricus TaxID=27687 RepID=A0A8C4SN39_ERPCA